MTQYEAAAKAAKLFKKRDALDARIKAIDADLAEATNDYAKAIGVFGFAPWMMRQACEARGLLVREDGL